MTPAVIAGRRLILLGLTACVACVGGSSRTAPTHLPPRCEATFTVPAGFGVAESVDDRYIDHIGVRVRLRDNRDREVELFFGVPGEYGEQAPIVGTRTAYSGETATLFRSPDENWTLAWYGQGPCGPTAVFGHGFMKKQDFLKVLEEAGMIAPR